ncbi:MAG: hypothetical protein JO110_25635 [Acetobacteraceae bacterium]|nr:hypothetical protein [Acetobacteraceae bacterium]
MGKGGAPALRGGERGITHRPQGPRSLGDLVDRIAPKSLTAVQRRLIQASSLAEAQDLLFQHTIFCQICLPYRDPGDNVREWECKQGAASLLIEAGRAKHPRADEWIKLGLPWGAKPRLILSHLNAEALRQGSPLIEIEGSLRGFVRRLKLDTGGRNFRIIKDQLSRLSAASIWLGLSRDGHAVTIRSHIVGAFELWFPKDDRQRVLWPSTVRLSQEYFDSLQKYAVPLEEAAISALAHSAMALDIYAWLAQRLHRISAKEPQFIPWAALQQQFGMHYNRVRKFREVFLHTLREVKAVYPAARIGEDLGRDGQPTGLTLYNSPSPVPKRSVVRPRD